MDKSNFKFKKKNPLIYSFIQMVRENSFSIFIEAHKSKVSLKTMKAFICENNSLFLFLGNGNY